ncbi:hypothetical protein [Afifella pfennigii]|uniref:hypothetical protein n=1 Tax=Afifella pfennigii TaxID=209897 RepID=UPI00047E4310|nr:hypothetical protein [Afifella pfennigii]
MRQKTQFFFGVLLLGAMLAGSAFAAGNQMSMPPRTGDTWAPQFLQLAQDVCAGVPSGELGRCTLENPPEHLDNLNCPACCAHRNALTWVSPNNAVNCR